MAKWVFNHSGRIGDAKDTVINSNLAEPPKPLLDAWLTLNNFTGAIVPLRASSG